MPNISRIPEAIADLESQEVPNIKAIAEKYNVNRKTLENRWKGKSVSMQEAISTYRQYLTTSQEKALISLIKDLTDRRMPPTTAIVKNLAEEIRGYNVGKNWAAYFMKRYQDILKSQYLSNIDNNRIKGEYPLAYEIFYQLVKYSILLF
jgi:transposase-like protein